MGFSCALSFHPESNFLSKANFSRSDTEKETEGGREIIHSRWQETVAALQRRVGGGERLLY